MSLYTFSLFQPAPKKYDDYYNLLKFSCIYTFCLFSRQMAHALLYWVVNAPRTSRGHENITQPKKGGAQ